MIRPVRSILVLLMSSLLAGCTAPVEPPRASSDAVERAPQLAPGEILLRFKTLDCVCHLGNVEFSLLGLAGVGSVEWEIERNEARLIFIDDRRPTDDAILTAISDSGVEIASIIRRDPFR